jgi:hypothetical protein
MTPSQILDQVRYLTKVSTSDGSGSESDLLRILNDYYLRQVMLLVNQNEDKFGKKAKTTLNILSAQESYTLPTDCIKAKRGEITYDGSNWAKLNIMDDNDVQGYALDTEGITDNFSTSNPYASVYGDKIWLRPIPTTSISLGLRLWYIGRPSLIANISTGVIKTPNEYHGYLIYGVAGEVATRQGNQNLASMMFKKWEDGKAKIEATFAPRTLDRRIGMKSYPVTYS